MTLAILIPMAPPKAQPNVLASSHETVPWKVLRRSSHCASPKMAPAIRRATIGNKCQNSGSDMAVMCNMIGGIAISVMKTSHAIVPPATLNNVHLDQSWLGMHLSRTLVWAKPTASPNILPAQTPPNPHVTDNMAEVKN